MISLDPQWIFLACKSPLTVNLESKEWKNSANLILSAPPCDGWWIAATMRPLFPSLTLTLVTCIWLLSIFRVHSALWTLLLFLIFKKVHVVKLFSQIRAMSMLLLCKRSSSTCLRYTNLLAFRAIICCVHLFISCEVFLTFVSLIFYLSILAVIVLYWLTRLKNDQNWLRKSI